MSDLLAKEKQFHRLNHNLQLKTHDVIKTVDSIIHAHADKNLFSSTNQLLSNFEMENTKIMYLQDIAPKINKQLKTSFIKVSEIPSIESNNDSLKKDNTWTIQKNMGNKAIIALLKGKIDMLYKKLQVMQLEYNNKVSFHFIA